MDAQITESIRKKKKKKNGLAKTETENIETSRNKTAKGGIFIMTFLISYGLLRTKTKITKISGDFIMKL